MTNPNKLSQGAAYTAAPTMNTLVKKNVRGRIMLNLTGLFIFGYLNRQMSKPRMDIATESEFMKL